MPALTFYTVLTDRDGYPVKYIQPADVKNAASYGRVQTFLDKEHPCGDPGEASQEFKACIGGSDACYLEPAQFRAKVRALHQLCRDAEKKLAAWKALSASR